MSEQDSADPTPFEILEDFRTRYVGTTGGFAMSRLILLARIIPEEITPDLVDPALSRRLLEAIARIDEHEAKLERKLEATEAVDRVR